jgi:hypothetical protein
MTIKFTHFCCAVGAAETEDCLLAMECCLVALPAADERYTDDAIDDRRDPVRCASRLSSSFRNDSFSSSTSLSSI